MTERKYALRRLGPGDYLLPSNDGVTLWRLRRYEEDGSLSRQTENGEEIVVGTFWSVWKFDHTIQGIQTASEDGFADWFVHDWHEHASLFRTRQAAIDWALEVDA